MKHRILIEFSADTLPNDFLDQIAGRVYGHPAVEKKECTASFVGDVLKDAARYRWIRSCPHEVANGVIDVCQWHDNAGSALRDSELDAAIDAAKDTQ